MESVAAFGRRLVDNVERVIVGKRSAIELLVVALLCDGHVLIEDVPGVGKTMLARALAVSLGGTFRRLQCTPDLLPNDVTGVSIYNQKSGEFEFRRGPAFVNVLLADELNRATPRTQSALLECMGEAQVSVHGVTHSLERPFPVLATQNPIEYEGTFPLPEAQLDRFLMRLRLGYRRLPADTPYEYARRAALAAPGARAELEALTHAFVEARYSQREIQRRQVGLLRSAYLRLRRACRRLLGRPAEGERQGGEDRAGQLELASPVAAGRYRPAATFST